MSVDAVKLQHLLLEPTALHRTACAKSGGVGGVGVGGGGVVVGGGVCVVVVGGGGGGVVVVVGGVGVCR